MRKMENIKNPKSFKWIEPGIKNIPRMKIQAKMASLVNSPK